MPDPTPAMALRFKDFSLLHQFTSSSRAEDRKACEPPAGPGKVDLPEVFSPWPPEGITDLALSNVAGLTYAELKKMGLQGLPGEVNLGDPNIEVVPALRELLAGRHGMPGRPQRVLTTVGASEANFLICATLLGQGKGPDTLPRFSKVILEDPTYPPLLNLPLGLGAEVLPWRRDPDHGFRLETERLVELLEISGPALVMMTNLHNPSGAPTGNHQLEAVAKVVGEAGGILVVDEIYRELESDLDTAGRLGDHCLAVGSLSKVYGVSGLRVGWVLGAPELLTPLRELKEYVSAVNSPICDLLALQALTKGDALVARARRIKQANLPRVKAFCEDRPELEWKPTCSLVSFIRVDHPLGSLELSTRLRERFKVLLSAGEHFGWPGYLRLGFGCPPPLLEERLERFGEALDALR